MPLPLPHCADDKTNKANGKMPGDAPHHRCVTVGSSAKRQPCVTFPTSSLVRTLRAATRWERPCVKHAGASLGGTPRGRSQGCVRTADNQGRSPPSPSPGPPPLPFHCFTPPPPGQKVFVLPFCTVCYPYVSCCVPLPPQSYHGGMKSIRRKITSKRVVTSSAGACTM